jgi:hypothetical protein
MVEAVELKLGPSTQSSNQSPPERGTEIPDAETGAQTSPYCLTEIPRRDSQGERNPAFRRNKFDFPYKSVDPETGWWAHQGSNLGPDD